MSSLEAKILKSIGSVSSDNDLQSSSIVTVNSNIYVTGQFKGTLDIGGGVSPISTISKSGAGFIAKYNSNLTPISLKLLGNTAISTDDYSLGSSITNSENGDIYVTGDILGINFNTSSGKDGNSIINQYANIPAIDINGDGSVLKKILINGTGTVNPGPNDNVLVMYTGILPDGTIFDYSTSPTNFSLSSTIKGFSEGIQTMVTGQKCLLIIEPQKAYGVNGIPPVIPPNTNLLYQVELFDSNDIQPTSVESYNGFVAKYDKNLNLLNVQYMSGEKKYNYTSNNICISVSKNGDVYVTGDFYGELYIGNNVPKISTNNKIGCIFIAKYSSNLTPQLLKTVNNNSTSNFSKGTYIVISVSGDVYIGGYFTGTLDIGGGIAPINNTTTKDYGFIARYSSNLIPNVLTGLDIISKSGHSEITSLALSTNDNIYVGGIFIGTLDIGNDVPKINSDNKINAFIAKYTNDLTPIILKKIGNDYNLSGVGSIVVSKNDDVYVTGTFFGTLDIGEGVPQITANYKNQCVFIAKYNSNLLPNILKGFINNTSNDSSASVAMDISTTDDLYVTGFFQGTIDIGNGVPDITNNYNIINCFIAKYNANGIHPEPICLVADTPINTDQGIVAIQNIDTAFHTIGSKPIVAITKAITPERHLICFEQHAMGINLPNKRTIMTPGHEVFYKGKLVQAKQFVGKIDGVHTVPYDGKVVYNVLLEKHGLMVVNNMTVETLHPENKVAKMILGSL